MFIWRSRWGDTDGIARCRETPAFPGGTYRVVLLWQVRAVDGPARLSVVLFPHADCGRAPLGDVRRRHNDVGELAARVTGAGHAFGAPAAHGPRWTPAALVTGLGSGTVAAGRAALALRYDPTHLAGGRSSRTGCARGASETASPGSCWAPRRSACPPHRLSSSDKRPPVVPQR
ncbi:hypothetical protein IPZ68_10765 [Streptomyces arenae]|nr:hypothetical protein [Streptomyces arenae]